MRAYLGELFEQKKYAEAAAMLERVLDRFPDNVRANTFNLAAARALMGQPDKAIDALEDGLRRGAFYSRWDFDGAVMAPLKQHPRFAAFFQANLDRIAEADKKAAMKLEVATPPGYDPARRYPLFVALHGGGENIAMLKPNWVSPRLQAEFIVAYVQSSQVADMTGFHWQDEARTRRDLQAAFSEVVAKYPVDRTASSSAGSRPAGFASLVTAFHQTLPARGFVALCPEPPTSVTDADITAAVNRGLRGALLTTELDRRVAGAARLAERWKKLGLDAEFAVTPNIGHWFPKDFGQQLDRAIERILAPLPERAPGWSRMASGTTNNLTGLWGASPTDVFAVGPKGTILHFDGRMWSPMTVAGEPHLLSIWGSSSRDVFVVGDNGVIVHYDGQAWTPMASGTTKNLISVWGTSSRDVFAAGYGGTVLHYDGASGRPWRRARPRISTASGAPRRITSSPSAAPRCRCPARGSSCASTARPGRGCRSPTRRSSPACGDPRRDDVFAVGVNLAILRFDGKAWTAMTANAPVGAGLAQPADPGVGHRAERRLRGRIRRRRAALRRPGVVAGAVGHDGGHGRLRRRPRDVFVVGGGGIILRHGRSKGPRWQSRGAP